MKYALLFLTMVSVVSAINYHGCALAPDHQHGWIACLDTVLILHTTNGGTSWTPQTTPSGTLRFFDVTCLDDQLAWTCGIEGEILHTKNGGSEWYQQLAAFAKYGTRIEFIDQNFGWAAGGDGLVAKTENGGTSWIQYPSPWPRAEFYGLWFVNQDEGWIVAGWPDSLDTGQGIIGHSTNGGINWTLLYESPTYEDFFDVFFFDTLSGVVVGGDEADYSPLILKTNDGGTSWDTIDAPPNSYYLRAVDFVGNEGWAVGRFGTIIHSTDSGATWTFQTSPATNTLFDVDFSDDLHGLACGYDMILRTTDGGQSWQNVGVQENQSSKPQMTALEVHPNPFRRMTNITLQMPNKFQNLNVQHQINLKIFDASGRLVKSFNPESCILNHESVIFWDGKDEEGRYLPGGVYFIRLVTPQQELTKKVTLLR
jgi:photosystem II stability/assembly factor-like uncharacterized protein